MARPIEIDRHQAFEIAVQLFWRQGYKSTSLQQLLDAMAIGKSSFYAAFESKEALFLDVLKHYCNETKVTLDTIRETQQGLAAIQAFLEQTLLDISDEVRGRGCLAVNSALELAGVDRELHDKASHCLFQLELELRSLLSEAQTKGEVDLDQSPEQLASLLIVLLQGLRVASRRGMTRSEASVTVSNLMQLIRDE